MSTPIYPLIATGASQPPSSALIRHLLDRAMDAREKHPDTQKPAREVVEDNVPQREGAMQVQLRPTDTGRRLPGAAGRAGDSRSGAIGTGDAPSAQGGLEAPAPAVRGAALHVGRPTLSAPQPSGRTPVVGVAASAAPLQTPRPGSDAEPQPGRADAGAEDVLADTSRPRTVVGMATAADAGARPVRVPAPMSAATSGSKRGAADGTVAGPSPVRRAPEPAAFRQEASGMAMAATAPEQQEPTEVGKRAALPLPTATLQDRTRTAEHPAAGSAAHEPRVAVQQRELPVPPLPTLPRPAIVTIPLTRWGGGHHVTAHFTVGGDAQRLPTDVLLRASSPAVAQAMEQSLQAADAPGEGRWRVERSEADDPRERRSGQRHPAEDET